MNAIRKHIVDNKAEFLLSFFIFLIATIIGAVNSDKISTEQAQMLRDYVEPLLMPESAGNINSGSIFVADVINHLKFVLIAAVSSFSLKLFPLLLLAFVTKGYQLGFALGFITSYFGRDGIMLGISSAILSYLFTIPIYFLILVTVFKHCRKINGIACARDGQKNKEILSCLVFLTVVYCFLCLFTLAEAFLTPLIIDFMN